MALCRSGRKRFAREYAEHNDVNYYMTWIYEKLKQLFDSVKQAF